MSNLRVAYFINTFKSTNWGGQATSTGIQYLLASEYPNSEFVPLDLPDLPFKKLKLLRFYYEKKLLQALIKNHHQRVQTEINQNGSKICFLGNGLKFWQFKKWAGFLAIQECQFR